LLGLGLINSVYLSEYFYMGVIFIMGYLLQVKFVKLQEIIEDINLNLEKLVAERTRELREARDALWGEMQIAEKIQTVLLPKNPSVRGYEALAYMKPAEQVGGDYYDIINTGANDWVIIGDVSGHGVSSGLVMMMVQSIIQAKLLEDPGIPPSKLLDFVNEPMKRTIEKMTVPRFMTIMAFSLDAGGSVRYSGRHDNPVLYRSRNAGIELLDCKGIILSGLNQDRDHDDSTVMIETGDVLVLYTDGITEAMNEHGEIYGKDKLARLVAGNGQVDLNTLLRKILHSLESYTVSDDITLVILKKL
jgi:serine phosphatase RsbU (regulator of sigma subunit)